jgi:endonuclease III-like uncharacterized protein
MSNYALSRRLMELEADRGWWLGQKLSAVTVADLQRASTMLREVEIQIRDLKREVVA